MSETLLTLEEQIESILQEYEQQENYEIAYHEYSQVEAQLLGLPVDTHQQRVLAACLMRQSNMLRSLGRVEEALELSQREIIAARNSADPITLARSLFSLGISYMADRKIEEATPYLEEAKALFESDNTKDHQQGIGWYWIIMADLINAGIVHGELETILDYAEKAIQILKPIENWRGVSRAYTAIATAYNQLADTGNQS